MADALERLAEPGEDLLRRVGALLSRGGFPPALAELSRRVGALPVDVLEYGIRLDVEALQTAAGEVRALRDQFREVPGRLSADVDDSAWAGSGAEAFRVVWAALAQFIGGDGDADSIVGRVDATASYLDGLAGWAKDFRHELAEAVARVISSAEAVVVVTSAAVPGSTAPPGVAAVNAASRIAERVLRVAADGLDGAEALRRRWEGRLGELEYQPPVVPRGSAVISGVTRVTL